MLGFRKRLIEKTGDIVGRIINSVGPLEYDGDVTINYIDTDGGLLLLDSDFDPISLDDIEVINFDEDELYNNNLITKETYESLVSLKSLPDVAVCNLDTDGLEEVYHLLHKVFGK